MGQEWQQLARMRHVVAAQVGRQSAEPARAAGGNCEVDVVFTGEP